MIKNRYKLPIIVDPVYKTCRLFYVRIKSALSNIVKNFKSLRRIFSGKHIVSLKITEMKRIHSVILRGFIQK